jgi:hypothetical protein
LEEEPDMGLDGVHTEPLLLSVVLGREEHVVTGRLSRTGVGEAVGGLEATLCEVLGLDFMDSTVGGRDPIADCLCDSPVADLETED